MTVTVGHDATPDTGGERRQPFVGPQSLGTGQHIYGRDREKVELANQIVADRIVVLYSPSGAGKTSLIDAGLRPELLERDLRALPSIRVGADAGGRNRYALSTLLSLDQSRRRDRQLTPEQLDRIGLGPYLHHLIESSDNGDDPTSHLSPCLVFDQFEELFTADPADEQAKHAFMAELGAALADRRWWALIALREDFVAQLDPYVHHFSTQLRSRYRLDLLRAEQAKTAMQRATKDFGVTTTDAAADYVIGGLRQVRVGDADSDETADGPYVEPVQLQVVGRRIWNEPRDDETTIELSHVENLGTVGDALASFYDDQISRVQIETGVPPRVTRRWVADKLISERNHRIPVDGGPDGDRGDAVLDVLDKGHLIRREDRDGRERYELSHDTLIEPIRESNRRWHDGLPLLPKKSEEWIEGGRSSVLLIGGEALDEALAWKELHPDDVSSEDEEFLEACSKERDSAEALRRAAEDSKRAERRFRRLALLLGLLFVVTVGALVFAVNARNDALDKQAEAERATAQATESLRARSIAQVVANVQRQLAVDAQSEAEAAQISEAEARLVSESGELAARSRALQADNPALALALAAESTAIASRPGADTLAAIAGARANLRDQAWQQLLEPVEQREPGAVAVAPDGERFAHAGCPPRDDDDGCARTTIFVRSVSDPTVIVAQLTPHNGSVRDLAYSPDGTRLVSAGGTQLWVWDTTTDEPEPEPIALDALPEPDDGGNLVVTSVAFDGTGDRLATGDSAGSVTLWEFADDEPSPSVLQRTQPVGTAVNDVAWRTDGELLASAETDGSIVLWDVGSASSIRTLTYPVIQEIGPAGIEAVRVAFHPDPATDALVAGHRTGMAWAWQLPNDDSATALPLVGHTEDIGGLVFVPGQDQVATSSGDDTIRLWTVGRDPEGAFTVGSVGEPFTEHSAFVRDLAITPDGSRLVSTSQDDTIRFWGFAADTGVRVLDHGWEECIGGDPSTRCFATAAAFGPGDRLLVSVGYDGLVRVWDGTALFDEGPVEPTLIAEIDTIPSADDAAGPGDDGEPSVEGDTDGQEDSARWLYSVAFHPDAERVLVGAQGRIWMWDRERDPDGVELVWESDDDDPPPVRAVAFDPGSTLAATSDDCGVIRVWDTDELEQLGSVGEGPCGTKIEALAFGDGVLVVGDGDGQVSEYTFDATTGALSDPETALSHGANVRGVDVGIGPDGDEFVASASEDELLLARLPDGDIPAFEGHSDSVGDVVANETYLASASNDGSARLWWLPPEPPIGEILPPGERCRSLVECFALDASFDSTGETLVTSGSDGLVHVWIDLLSPETACRLAEPMITQRQLERELGFEPEVCFVDA